MNLHMHLLLHEIPRYLRKDHHSKKFNARKWQRQQGSRNFRIYKAFLKSRSNKLIRRTTDIPLNGRGCYKVFDYAWELY